MPPDSHAVTRWLAEWRSGDQAAGNQLFVAVYDELRRIAARQMQQERSGHTLQPTALVNELYLKLFGGDPLACQSRAHFFAVAAQQLRRLLIDHARARLADKRGGREVRVPLDEANVLGVPAHQDVLELDDSLRKLEQLDPRSARAVELRFFGGLTEAEAAEVLGVSVATLKRDWDFARAWLMSRLAGPPG